MVQVVMMLGTVVGYVLVSWGPVVAELVLGIAVADSPEAHVHVLEHFFDHGIVVDADCGSVVALDGQVGLRPAHFYDSVSKGYHGFGADEDAQEFGFSGGRRDVFDDLCNG